MSEASQIEKKTSWIELYFDLIFVLAIAQVSHAVAEEPGWRAVWIGLGLFAVLWWTWIGFALFYNRYGDEHSLWQRLAVIVATIPCGIAAVAVPEMVHGHRTVFTLSLVGARLVLAAVHFLQEGKLPRRIAIGYVLAALALVISLALPNPWWWVLWIVAIAAESFNVFSSGPYRKLSRKELTAGGKDWRKALSMMKPADPAYALNVPHLAERFGLFMIILLGEVVVTAGQGALGGDDVTWSNVVAVIVLAGLLWWIYFDSAAETNERMFELTGGSPQMARSFFALGRMVPAFALVVIAAGLRLLLIGHPGQEAYWLVSAGLGVYLIGMRVDVGTSPWAWLRLLLFALTIPLGLLGEVLSQQAYLWVMCGWMVICAVAGTYGGHLVQSALGKFSGK